MRTITECRSCHSNKLEKIISLGDQYLSAFGIEGKPKQYPLNLVICKSCTLVQLKETTHPEELYTDDYGYYSGINQTMRDELAGIVKEAVARRPLVKGDIVVDIGANDGTLLSNYDPDIIRIGFDPVPKLVKMMEPHVTHAIHSYFEANEYFKVTEKRAKIVTAISMFYDLDEPNSFVADIAKVLDTDGVCVIQQNYLAEMIKKNAFDNIVHEHLEYYSLKSLEHLLNRHGLEVFDAEIRDLNGGSFRTYVRHMRGVEKIRRLEGEMGLDKLDTYKAMATRMKKVRAELRDTVEEIVKDGKRVYVYGASTRGNTLLQYCDLGNDLITAAVERNPDKWGLKIASLDIPIISEEDARRENPEYMLVLPWFFEKEFIAREKDYLDKGGHFIFPLPEVHII